MAPTRSHDLPARHTHQAGPALALALAMALAFARPALAAEPDAADQAFYRRAASCAGVMKQEVVRLAGRWRAGERGVRGEVQRLTELSFAFVGVAYKRGLRGEAADRLLAEAERTQAAQGAAVLRQLSADCQAEGRQLLDKSNSLERMLVRNRAKARVGHLLDDALSTPANATAAPAATPAPAVQRAAGG
ncbi:hypothetical protein [Aquabacterium sp. OR-4]|uniref:hypothetical protein n=1 Tax=Aquabacterium sp. OR-4 TaxID=2978127 RepID=UPI0021B1A5BC|nr:hypothetical protein [Aquabacterium sp. OR-4]MDT7835712.1 hypothetical protein [Aquabacterium sp. OR-4]